MAPRDISGSRDLVKEGRVDYLSFKIRNQRHDSDISILIYIARENSPLLNPQDESRYGRSLTVPEVTTRRHQSSQSSSMSRRSMRVTRSSWFLMLLTLSIGGYG